MITRIVKMELLQERKMDFLASFGESQAKIMARPGCHSVVLKEDSKNPLVVFTISTWSSEKDLNDYRASELFGSIWPKVKLMFSGSPEAWSLTNTTELLTNTKR